MVDPHVTTFLRMTTVIAGLIKTTTVIAGLIRTTTVIAGLIRTTTVIAGLTGNLLWNDDLISLLIVTRIALRSHHEAHRNLLLPLDLRHRSMICNC